MGEAAKLDPLVRTPLRVLLAVAACTGSACLAGPVSDWPAKDHDDRDDEAPAVPHPPSARPPATNTGASAPEGDGLTQGVDAGRANELLDGGVVDTADGGPASRCTEVDDAGHCTK